MWAGCVASCSFFKYTKIDLEEVAETTDRIEYCFLIDKQAVIWYTKNKQRKVLC